MTRDTRRGDVSVLEQFAPLILLLNSSGGAARRGADCKYDNIGDNDTAAAAAAGRWGPVLRGSTGAGSPVSSQSWRSMDQVTASALSLSLGYPSHSQVLDLLLHTHTESRDTAEYTSDSTSMSAEYTEYTSDSTSLSAEYTSDSTSMSAEYMEYTSDSTRLSAEYEYEAYPEYPPGPSPSTQADWAVACSQPPPLETAATSFAYIRPHHLQQHPQHHPQQRPAPGPAPTILLQRTHKKRSRPGTAARTGASRFADAGKREQYKRAACERERARMKDCNKIFAQLRAGLPAGAGTGKRVSKIETLRLAIRYIRHLRAVLSWPAGHQVPAHLLTFDPSSDSQGYEDLQEQ